MKHAMCAIHTYMHYVTRIVVLAEFIDASLYKTHQERHFLTVQCNVSLVTVFVRYMQSFLPNKSIPDEDCDVCNITLNTGSDPAGVSIVQGSTAVCTTAVCLSELAYRFVNTATFCWLTL